MHFSPRSHLSNTILSFLSTTLIWNSSLEFQPITTKPNHILFWAQHKCFTTIGFPEKPSTIAFSLMPSLYSSSSNGFLWSTQMFHNHLFPSKGLHCFFKSLVISHLSISIFFFTPLFWNSALVSYHQYIPKLFLVCFITFDFPENTSNIFQITRCWILTFILKSLSGILANYHQTTTYLFLKSTKFLFEPRLSQKRLKHSSKSQLSITIVFCFQHLYFEIALWNFKQPPPNHSPSVSELNTYVSQILVLQIFFKSNSSTQTFPSFPEKLSTFLK